MSNPLFRKKSLDSILADADEPAHQLKRALGPIQLIALGIGAIIGAGIFAGIGSAAAGGAHHAGAGPALVISILITAIGCGFCALCYAEFASIVPISGSAYTYSYATLGEFIAWIIGWDLIIEYAMGNVAVAVSWSGYFVELLRGFGIDIPAWMRTDLLTASRTAGFFDAAPHVFGIPIVFNLPAVLITALVTWVLVIGIKESSQFNTGMVVLKLVILVFFIVVGAFYVKPANWQPFAPNGWAGIGSGAALIFFAYIGFDAVSTAAEECRNPQKDMPIGMIGSLAICTVLYIATSLVLTGMVPLTEIQGSAEPLAKAFSLLGMNWAAGIVAFGAVIATTAVLLVFQYGQARIFFSMARDGLLPESFSRVHPRFKTPHVTTIWIGVAVGLLSAFANLDVFIELTNIGTLFAFILVCIGILVLRRTDPHRKRVLPHAVRALRADRRHRDLPLSDRGLSVVPLDARRPQVRALRRPSGRHMAALRSLARAGSRHLLPVRLPEVPPRQSPHLIPTSPATLLKSPPGRPGAAFRFSSQEVGMRFGRLASAAVFMAVLSAPLFAQASTKKYDWAPINGVQEVDVRDGEVVVSQLVFNLGSTLKGTPIRKSSADVRVRIDNNGLADQQVGVAVVVFDAEGNVVAAGSNGTKWGYLNKGSRTYYNIDFPYVYRRLDQAANFVVTIETQGKDGKTTTTTTTTTTTDTTGSASVESEPLPTPTPVP